MRVNDGLAVRIDQMPFGGAKDSGLGCGGSLYAVEEFTEPRLMVLNLKSSV